MAACGKGDKDDIRAVVQGHQTGSGHAQEDIVGGRMYAEAVVGLHIHHCYTCIVAEVADGNKEGNEGDRVYATESVGQTDSGCVGRSGRKTDRHTQFVEAGTVYPKDQWALERVCRVFLR